MVSGQQNQNKMSKKELAMIKKQVKILQDSISAVQPIVIKIKTLKLYL